MASFADLKNARGARQTSRTTTDPDPPPPAEGFERLLQIPPGEVAEKIHELGQLSAAVDDARPGPSSRPQAYATGPPAEDPEPGTRHPQHDLMDYPDGIELQHVEGKGRGLFATRSFRAGKSALLYSG